MEPIMEGRSISGDGAFPGKDDAENSGENRKEKDSLQEEKGPEASGSEEGTPREIRKRLEKLEKENSALQEEVSRARADYYNLRQRTARDASKQRALASETAVRELVPVLDNLDRALGAADKDDPLLKGVSMVRRQFFEALKLLGLEEIESRGAFDPSLHEAVGVIPVEDSDLDGTVVEELQKGYLLGGKVLRASQVRIGSLDRDSASEESRDPSE
ncbi:MAG TPA: nucleotide exchange factor GrpE [Synergistaceae bacterium]|nr:nucleotide exchange factor GrpE [Synergistaceae bacterium]